MTAPLIPHGLVRARRSERPAGRPFSRVAELTLVALFGLLAIYAVLLPLAPDAGLVPPDLLYCLVIAWVLRTPKPLPVLLIAGLGLLADVMLSRPPGLGALGLLLSAEFIRGRAGRIIGAPFPMEWAAATLTFALMLVGMQALLHLTFAVPPSVGDLARHAVGTAVAYPGAAIALVWGLGLRAGARPA